MKNPHECWILVVDDSHETREWACKTLKQFKFNVTTAASGNDAKRVLAEHKMDVVLTDVYMPNGNGIELLEWVRAFYPGVSVYLMSGNPLVHTDPPLEADGVFLKPIDYEKLVQSISNSCRHSA